MVRPEKTSPLLAALQITNTSEWISHPAQEELLRLVTCGSVDDGKSTLIGHLLFGSGQVFKDELSVLQVDSKRIGTSGDEIDFALLVDGLTAEREQGITIDVAYRFFSTPSRKFIVADAPGHEQYTRNMVTAASTADVAVLLIDARKGMLTQTRRHAYLASLIGIKEVVLAINKMDLVNYCQTVFEKIVAEFTIAAESLGLRDFTPIPLSALKGDNVIQRSPHTRWYEGPTLLGLLETIKVRPPGQNKTIFPVQLVNRPNADFRGFSGTLAAGKLKLGDALRITASGQTARLAKIVTADGDLNSARAGNAVTLVLDKQVDASRGDILCLADQPLEMSDQFECTLVWMHEEAGLVGRVYDLKLANQWASASITTFKYRVDVNNQTHTVCRKTNQNDIVVANLALSKQIVFAPYNDSRALGGFILVDKFNHATVAAGIIHHSLRRAQNVHRQILSVTREDREYLNGHEGKVIWLTGLSGSGKSTIANALEKELFNEGKRTYTLDGDNIRQGLSRDLGFTDADRVENIRRVAEVAKLMMDAGTIVITAFISPFRAEREMAQHLIGLNNFIEVFVDAPLEVCEKRDPKGLYKKARSGKLPNMTGIDSPYEPPQNPDIVLSTSNLTVEEAVRLVSRFLWHP